MITRDYYYSNVPEAQDDIKKLEEIEEKRKCLLININDKFTSVIETQIKDLQKIIQWIEFNPFKESEVTSFSERFHNEVFNSAQERLRQKIHSFIWIISGCPQGKFNFGKDKLKKDPFILTTIHPLLGNLTFLNQVLQDFECDLKLTELEREFLSGNKTAKQKLDQLAQGKVDFFKTLLNNLTFSHRQMNTLFHHLHPVIQNKLIDQGLQPPFYGRGFNPNLYKTLGAHHNGYTKTTTFQVYAPNATQVVLNLTAFQQTEKSISMTRGKEGIWSAESCDALPGRTYHFMITDSKGSQPVKKVDPFAFHNIIHDPQGKRENHESVVVDIDKTFEWQDGAWVNNRKNLNFSKKDPLAIYEVHSPSWKFDREGNPLNWRSLAIELGNYCKMMGYNAVELMGMFAHPQPISMGYQITNFFAPNCEMGSWEDFQFFVNHMHTLNLGNNRQGIFIIADWVPAHFAIDSFALSEFDGSPLLENDDPIFAFHPSWGTKSFDYKKQFTQDFLASNLAFLFQKLGLDGIRVDAVTSMLYLNQGGDQKRYNHKGGAEDLDGKHFLRNVTTYFHQNVPGCLFIAEECLGFHNLTRPVEQKGIHTKTGGIGFDLTWHMGFMNDTLRYWQMPAEERQQAYGLLTHTVQAVDGHEDIRPRGKVVLPYSHDENANGKSTIFTKMSGKNNIEKFANGRLALAFQLLRGGGPILEFMGNEILQTTEWHARIKENSENRNAPPKTGIQWEELDPQVVDKSNAHLHQGAQKCRQVLLHLYQDNVGLWDQTDDGFAWINAEDSQNGVVSFHRRNQGQQFACIFNTSDHEIKNYKIPLPDQTYAPELDQLVEAKIVYNTDEKQYGGLGRVVNHTAVEILKNSNGRPTHFQLRSLPPYTAIVLEEKFKG